MKASHPSRERIETIDRAAQLIAHLLLHWDVQSDIHNRRELERILKNHLNPALLKAGLVVYDVV